MIHVIGSTSVRSGAGAKTAVRSWAKADVSSVPQALVPFIQAVDNFKIGLFVPGSVLTPTGQVSFPARRAARSFRQNSSSCSRFIRTIRSSSALSETASFHLIMRPPSPLVRLGAFAIVAEERGFLMLSRALKLITQRRFFCGGSLLLSGRVIHLDGDSLILEPHSSGHHVPLSHPRRRRSASTRP